MHRKRTWWQRISASKKDVVAANKCIEKERGGCKKSSKKNVMAAKKCIEKGRGCNEKGPTC